MNMDKNKESCYQENETFSETGKHYAQGKEVYSPLSIRESSPSCDAGQHNNEHTLQGLIQSHSTTDSVNYRLDFILLSTIQLLP